MNFFGLRVLFAATVGIIFHETHFYFLLCFITHTVLAWITS